MTIKRFLIFQFLLMSAIMLTAQTPVKRNPGDFSVVTVTGKIRVELYKADSSGLVIETSETSPENVITESDGYELSIHLKTNTPKNAEIRVLVYYKMIKALNVAAQGLIVSPDVLQGESVDFDAKSGGKMELKLEVNTLQADVRQGAILVFGGVVEKQTISVNTGATYSAYELEARDTYVKASSGGKAKVIARRIIDATANAKGYIGYRGDPVSTFIKTNLGGEIANFKEEDQ